MGDKKKHHANFQILLPTIMMEWDPKDSNPHFSAAPSGVPVPDGGNNVLLGPFIKGVPKTTVIGVPKRGSPFSAAKGMTIRGDEGFNSPRVSARIGADR